MTPVFVQIKYFLNTVAIGLMMGIVFDFYRAIRFFKRPHKWTAHVLDVFISVILTALVFLLLLFSNWGEVRFYVFIGIGLGLGIYMRCCSGKILVLWLNWIIFLSKSIKAILKIMSLPIKLFTKFIAWPLSLVSLLLYKVYKSLKPLLGKVSSTVKCMAKPLLIVFHKLKKP
jgi:spore cortex biosynthesis protein YabQ